MLRMFLQVLRKTWKWDFYVCLSGPFVPVLGYRLSVVVIGTFFLCLDPCPIVSAELFHAI